MLYESLKMKAFKCEKSKNKNFFRLLFKKNLIKIKPFYVCFDY